LNFSLDHFSLDTLKDPTALMALTIPVAVQIVSAILTFYIGRWLLRLVTGALERMMRRAGADITLASFLTKLAFGVGYAVVIIATLGQLGVDTTSAAAVMGGAALAIGLSLQSQLSSLAAGILLIVFRPFKVGDFVDIGGVMGTVREITVMHTHLVSPNNQDVVMPNSAAAAATITNYSLRDTRRIELTLGVGYGADLRKVRQVLERIVREEPRLLAEPAPIIQIAKLDTSSVNFVFLVWTTSAEFGKVQSDLLEKIKTSFDAEGIEIPFPQMSVHVEKLPPQGGGQRSAA